MRVKRQVAKDLNVDEEQVQELIDGKRHIGGETMDKVLQSINDEAENRIARDFEILDWYTNTDLKALRLEWGYGQKELANKLKINPITLNAVESKYSAAKNVTPNIQKLYDFYHIYEFDLKFFAQGKTSHSLHHHNYFPKDRVHLQDHTQELPFHQHNDGQIQPINL